MSRRQNHRDKPEAILNYFHRVQREHQPPPTLREIGAAVGISSPSVVKRHVECLLRDGRLRTHPSDARRCYAPEPKAPSRSAADAPRRIDLDRLRRDFRAACRAAGLDPAVGTTNRYEVVRAKAAAVRLRQRQERRGRRFRWWQIDWSEPGLCRSDVEYEAIFRLFQKSWRFRSLWRRVRNEGGERIED
ncbi:MAG: hypothetical protein JNL42_08655 [Anaerolineae bacterium]|nr:hypothetical protein [Anaerolineae bacterium]